MCPFQPSYQYFSRGQPKYQERGPGNEVGNVCRTFQFSLGLSNVKKRGWELGCSLPTVAIIVSCTIVGLLSNRTGTPDDRRTRGIVWILHMK